MATLKKSHPLNRPGPLFTDTTCIDCGTCFHLGPDIFQENSDDKSIVIRQPDSREDWLQAKQAILSCPTNSIGVHEAPLLFKELPIGLPLRITDEVFYLGFTAKESFGATSYLILREEGNVLVDSPRFHPLLVKEIEALGGARLMFLTHQDDVADHQKFRDHFKLHRIIHKDDVTSDTSTCEIILDGVRDTFISDDLKIIRTPGHSKGHLNLLFNHKYLFTGDHLFTDGSSITASKNVCWYSWAEQTRSVEKLLKENFEWIMPGHGGWSYFGVEEGQKQIRLLVDSMKGMQ
jgi:glyoxylase-like metal-dependent hydrolase (beta-lactamase superfamily II)/ferredoxin